jgi:UDP-glucose 4-epimerase
MADQLTVKQRENLRMYLVTGGCGFIGSHLVDYLVAKGHLVRVFDDLSSSSKKYLPKEAEFICGSLTDETKLQQTLDGVTHIFHLAAMVSVPHSVTHWYQSHLVNCGGTIRLLELAKKIPIVFASSSAVYGDLQQLPHSEGAFCDPLSPYAVDKLSCEWHAKIAWQLHETPAFACRFFNVYGPRQNPASPYSGVISKFADCIARGTSLPIYGDGRQRRDFIFVQDVVQMLYKAMESLQDGAHVCNFCTGETCTVNDLADLMMKITGVELKKDYLPERPGDIYISQGNPLKAWQEMKLKAETSLEEGLKLLMQEILPRGMMRS